MNTDELFRLMQQIHEQHGQVLVESETPVQSMKTIEDL